MIAMEKEAEAAVKTKAKKVELPLPPIKHPTLFERIKEILGELVIHQGEVGYRGTAFSEPRSLREVTDDEIAEIKRRRQKATSDNVPLSYQDSDESNHHEPA